MDDNLPVPTAPIPEFADDESRERYWRERIGDWKESGLTQAEYARRHRITISTFGYWKRRFEPQPPSNAFVSVSAASLSPVRLHHPNGLVVECAAGTDIHWLRQLMGIADAP